MKKIAFLLTFTLLFGIMSFAYADSGENVDASTSEAPLLIAPAPSEEATSEEPTLIAPAPSGEATSNEEDATLLSGEEEAIADASNTETASENISGENAQEQQTASSIEEIGRDQGSVATGALIAVVVVIVLVVAVAILAKK